jgi:hypothetical protein
LTNIALFVWLLGKANKANKWTLLALTTCEVACLWEPLIIKQRAKGKLSIDHSNANVVG